MSKINRWEEGLSILKSIIEKTELTPAIKWGTEIYTYNGKNVVGCLGFKNCFVLWFYNGVFLEDKHNVLLSAQEGKTRALRQWRFTAEEEIDEKLILEYINEAIRNEKEGRVWKFEKSTSLKIPEILQSAMNQVKDLKEAFDKLTFCKQREFA